MFRREWDKLGKLVISKIGGEGGSQTIGISI